jgi:uncharacterized protein YndB with AHSA1/START domain
MMTKHNYEYEFPVPLEADRSTVFEHLSNAEKLGTWFAEYVEVEPRVGGAFRFWGRHTFGASDQEQATQTIVRFEPPEVLAFTWHLLDRDSEVTWSLSEEQNDGGTVTKLKVNHEFQGLPDIGRAEALIDDLWRIHTGNLCFHVNGVTDLYRPDFSDPHPEVRCEIVIDAPPEIVFAALITPQHIKEWFSAPDPVVEPHVGGKYGFGFSYELDGKLIEPPPMTILEIVENEKLVTTWPDWRGDPDVPDQQISWLLEDLGGRTRLILLHGGFTRAADVSDYPFGWQQFLDKIRQVAEAF